MDSDEDDFDIDDILQGLDLDTNTSKGSTGQKTMASALKPDPLPPKDKKKDIMSVFQAEPNQKATVKIQSAPAANKAVRFSETANTKPTQQQQPQTTQPLTDMFLKPSGESKADQGKGILLPPSNIGTAKNPAPRATPKPANDWLGLGDDNSPISTPPEQRVQNLKRNPPPVKQQATVFDSEDETSDDNDLMRTLGLKPLSSKSDAGNISTKTSGPLPPSSNFNPTARQQPKSAGIPDRPNPNTFPNYSYSSSQPISSPPVSANYPSSLTPTRSGPGSLEMLNPPAVGPSTRDPKVPPFPNPPSQSQTAKTVLDTLPFLNTLTTPGTIQQQHHSDASSAPTHQGDNVSTPNPTATGPKKKTVKIASSGNNNNDANTLTLPSHLIDQDQLKAMVSSLKTLYETQMENLEKGYVEQIEFVHQSSRRKEELLKDEIKAIQKNYDSRLERLKNELQESETKVPQKFQQELNSVMQQLTRASSNMANGNGENTQLDKASLIQEIDKSVEKKMSSFTQQIEDVIYKGIQSQSENSNNKQMEQAFAKLQDVIKMREEDVRKMHDKIDDSDIKMSSNIRKLVKEQQKMRENIIKAAVGTISNELAASNQDRLHKKDKTTSQVKEFRKDLRRLIYDLEVKNDSMHKSQLSIEMEQKNIAQTIRDLNSFLHSSATQQAINSGPSNANITSQMSTMQAMQHQAQNEMEMKILREERTTLSESIAKIQVERHKLNEERVLLEKDKLEFERERNRIRELEVQLRVKVSEAEEKIMQAETVRREETGKSKEIETKMREMESHHMYVKDQFHTAEQKLQMREQRLYQDKTELIQEKEFLDKLRDQLLCPGCLKSLTVPSTGSQRSAGDGLDFTHLTKLQNFSTTFDATLNMPYFQKESKYLDYLYENKPF